MCVRFVRYDEEVVITIAAKLIVKSDVLTYI